MGIPVDITSPIWLSHNTLTARPSTFVGVAFFTNHNRREWKSRKTELDEKEKIQNKTIPTFATQCVNLQVDLCGHFQEGYNRDVSFCSQRNLNSWFESWLVGGVCCVRLRSTWWNSRAHSIPPDPGFWVKHFGQRLSTKHSGVSQTRNSSVQILWWELQSSVGLVAH